MKHKILKSVAACSLGIMSLTSCSTPADVSEASITSSAQDIVLDSDESSTVDVKIESADVDIATSVVSTSDSQALFDNASTLDAGYYDIPADRALDAADYTYTLHWVRATDDYTDIDFAVIMLDSEGQFVNFGSSCPDATEGITMSGVTFTELMPDAEEQLSVYLDDVPAEVKLMYVMAYAHTADDKPCGLSTGMSSFYFDVADKSGDKLLSPADFTSIDKQDGIILDCLQRSKDGSLVGGYYQGGFSGVLGTLSTPEGDTFLGYEKAQDWKRTLIAYGY